MHFSVLVKIIAFLPSVKQSENVNKNNSSYEDMLIKSALSSPCPAFKCIKQTFVSEKDTFLRDNAWT